MPPLGILIKPASSSCNLRCKYCFYHSVAQNRSTKSYGIMDFKLLETLVHKALDFAEQSCTFAFQGGEPTLAGLDFYKKLMELENKYNKNKVKIYNSFQTNGILIDKEWTEFLASNKFLVGLSLDGHKELHDSNRIDAKSDGTYNKVMNTVELFNIYKVEYNILFVVSGHTARHANKLYSFFKRNDFRYLQFIPCLDPLNEQPGGNEYSLKPDRFTQFLKNLFDLWFEDVMKGEICSIRFFDNLVGMLIGYRPEVCGMSGVCQCQFVIEADGGTYPCDFYVTDEWLLGNISDKSFNELMNSNRCSNFIESSKYVDPKCSSCKWLNLCRGGCRRQKEPFTDSRPALNYYCQSYYEFFDYAAPKLKRIAAMTSQGPY